LRVASEAGAKEESLKVVRAKKSQLASEAGAKEESSQRAREEER
jgi:hypothetical protein